MAKVSQERKLECKRVLTELLPPGSTVYVIIRSTSSSGMSRKMSFLALTSFHDGTPWIRDITTYVGDILGDTVSEVKGDWVVNVHGSGSGLDMVYNIGMALHADEHSLNMQRL